MGECAGMTMCGDAGEPCCAVMGAVNYCTEPGALCIGESFTSPGMCEACGGRGERCCPGQACDDPAACCAGGRCVAAGEMCPAATDGGSGGGVCRSGGCAGGTCGRIGEPCCGRGLGCTQSYSVCGSGGVCVSCGGRDEVCCGGECVPPYRPTPTSSGCRCRLP
jgi:hypothetical protein